MFRPHLFLMFALVFLRGAVAQETGISRSPDTAEDTLRKQMLNSLTAFLTANPNLERDISTAPPAELRRQIAESRGLAKTYVTQKQAFYDLAVASITREIKIMSKEKTVDPQQLVRLREASNTRSAEVKAELKKASALRADLQRRIKAAVGLERQRLESSLVLVEDQKEFLDILTGLLVDEAAELENLRDQAGRDKKTIDALRQIKEDKLSSLSKMKGHAKKAQQQYENFFNALDTYVDGRDAGGKAASPRTKKK